MIYFFRNLNPYKIVYQSSTYTHDHASTPICLYIQKRMAKLYEWDQFYPEVLQGKKWPTISETLIASINSAYSEVFESVALQWQDAARKILNYPVR